MKRLSLISHIALAGAVLICGCETSKQAAVKPTIFSADEVVATPEKFQEKVIVIKGCFVSGFETSSLQPCKIQHEEQRIWVDSDTDNEPGLNPDLIPEELKPANPNESVWKKLPHCQNQLPIPVVFIGRFKTIADKDATRNERGFGHMGACQHRLTLLNILQSTRPRDCVPFPASSG